MSGKFIWYELMTNDRQAAEKFYGEVVGWTARDAGMPDVEYSILSTGDRPVVGMMAIPKEMCDQMQPGWMGYVEAPDVDAMAERVKAAGGQIARPAEDIPGVGRFAVVSDAGGAFFCLMRDDNPAGPEPAQGTPGHVGWRELNGGNLDADSKFYAGLFGWTYPDRLDMGPLGFYQIFATADGAQAGGMMTKLAEVPHPFWLFYFAVGDIDAAEGRIKAAGGKILNGPMEVPGEDWIIQAHDPEGVLFAVVGKRAK